MSPRVGTPGRGGNAPAWLCRVEPCVAEGGAAVRSEEGLHLPAGGTRPPVCHEGLEGLCSFLPPTSSSTDRPRPGLGKEAEGPRKAEVDMGKASPLWEAGPCPHGGLAAAAGSACAGEMTSRVWATWLPSAVFLLQAPGERGWARAGGWGQSWGEEEPGGGGWGAARQEGRRTGEG